MSTKVTIMFLTLLCCSLALTGCKDAEKEKAIAEAAARVELEKVRAVLEKTESEKKALKAETATISETLREVNSELAMVTQAHDQLELQVPKLLLELALVKKTRDQWEKHTAECREQFKQLQMSTLQLQDQPEKKADEPIARDKNGGQSILAFKGDQDESCCHPCRQVYNGLKNF